MSIPHRSIAPSSSSPTMRSTMPRPKSDLIRRRAFPYSGSSPLLPMTCWRRPLISFSDRRNENSGISTDFHRARFPFESRAPFRHRQGRESTKRMASDQGHWEAPRPPDKGPCIRAPRWPDIPSAIRLLRSNYQPGDFVAIERAIREADPLDDNGWQSVGLAVLDLIEAAAIPPIQEPRHIAQSLRKNIPCSLCREEVVRKLMISIPRPEVDVEGMRV